MTFYYPLLSKSKAFIHKKVFLTSMQTSRNSQNCNVKQYNLPIIKSHVIMFLCSMHQAMFEKGFHEKHFAPPFGILGKFHNFEAV